MTRLRLDFVEEQGRWVNRVTVYVLSLTRYIQR